MKRMLAVLVVLLLTAPVLAVPSISCSFTDDNVATISYSGVDPNNRIVAFGLDITAVDANITVGGWDPNVDDYWVYPGSIDINDGNVIGYGTPVAAEDSQGEKDPGKTIEMGALWNVGEGIPAPNAPAGDLLTVTVDGSCTLYVTGNTTRGGVVLQDGTTIPVDSNCTYTVVQECLKDTEYPGNVLNGYTAWVAWGEPNCWCYRRQCRGDTDGAKIGPYWVQLNDLNLFKIVYFQYDSVVLASSYLGTPGICADFDHQKLGPYRVQLNDLNAFKVYYFKYEVDVNECPPTHINFWTN